MVAAGGFSVRIAMHSSGHVISLVGLKACRRNANQMPFNWTSETFQCKAVYRRTISILDWLENSEMFHVTFCLSYDFMLIMINTVEWGDSGIRTFCGWFRM